jgi:hypothetical protein
MSREQELQTRTEASVSYAQNGQFIFIEVDRLKPEWAAERG